MKNAVSFYGTKLESLGKSTFDFLQWICAIILFLVAAVGVVLSFIFLCYHNFSFQWYGVREDSFYQLLLSFNKMVYSLNHAPGVNWKITAGLHMGAILYCLLGCPLADSEDGDPRIFGWIIFACSTWIFPWLFMLMMLAVILVLSAAICTYLVKRLWKNVRSR